MMGKPKDRSKEKLVNSTKETSEDDEVSDNRGDDYMLAQIEKMIQTSQEKVVNEVKTKLEDHEKRIGTLVSSELQVVKTRLDMIENPPFGPERTVVISDLPRTGSGDQNYIQELFTRVGLQDKVKVVNVKRMTQRGPRPGLIKVELSTVEEKVEVLRKKLDINNLEPDTWMRSSQSHAERLNDLNFKTLLTMIPGGDEWRVTANGRLQRRDEEFNGNPRRPPRIDEEIKTGDQDWIEGQPRGRYRGRGLGRGRNGFRGGGRGRSRGRMEDRYGRFSWNEDYHRGIPQRTTTDHNNSEQARLKRDREKTGDTPERNGPAQPFPLDSSTPLRTPVADQTKGEEGGATGGVEQT